MSSRWIDVSNSRPIKPISFLGVDTSRGYIDCEVVTVSLLMDNYMPNIDRTKSFVRPYPISDPESNPDDENI